MEARLKCWECGRRVIPAGMRSHRERGCSTNTLIYAHSRLTHSWCAPASST